MHKIDCKLLISSIADSKWSRVFQLLGFHQLWAHTQCKQIRISKSIRKLLRKGHTTWKLYTKSITWNGYFILKHPKCLCCGYSRARVGKWWLKRAWFQSCNCIHSSSLYIINFKSESSKLYETMGVIQKAGSVTYQGKFMENLSVPKGKWLSGWTYTELTNTQSWF